MRYSSSKPTYVLEEYLAFIFRIEENSNNKLTGSR
jgi:hypothetical protein